jgi:hypothetical protein
MFTKLFGTHKKRSRVQCVDGFTMSVQAGPTHYCEPRDGNGPYRAVEVGYPSDYEELLIQYAEVEEEPTRTVYGYVPSKVVSLVIAKHGGIMTGEVPPGVLDLRVTSDTED